MCATRSHSQTLISIAWHALLAWKTDERREHSSCPLELLVAFESAARHLSFTRAGAEIALTQSAVSRQVLALEDRLGVRCFVACTVRSPSPRTARLLPATLEGLDRARPRDARDSP
jgi:hypothetical protein